MLSYSRLFQSTLPREERLKQLEALKLELQFQSTLPREERRFVSDILREYDRISIHAPTRGATLLVRNVPRAYTAISIHAPTRGATIWWAVLTPMEVIFQSTLPREERPNELRKCKAVFSISIHAPTRGATSLGLFKTEQKQISIHAPTRGAT